MCWIVKHDEGRMILCFCEPNMQTSSVRDGSHEADEPLHYKDIVVSGYNTTPVMMIILRNVFLLR